ncbi:MAG: tetratricopeptide repeat protein [Flavobacteriales bacterium]|nr:tetratricopeptide repeat protein [Flavobacteriales bacterium]
MHRSLLVLLATLVLDPVAVKGQSVDALLSAGDSLMVLERYGKAIDRFDQAVALEASARTFSARAKAYYAVDRLDQFMVDVEQALRADSTYPEANYHRALYAFRGEDLPGTIRYATRGLGGSPDPKLQARLHLLRGEAKAELNDHAGAIDDLEQGARELPGDLEASKTQARCYDAIGDHENALTVLERLCEIEPDNVGNWSNRGFELAELGRYDEALTIIGTALDIDKDEPVALSNRAYILMKLGREDEAMKDVDRSLRYYPSNAFALRTRALLRLRKGDREKACSDLSLARILGGVDDVDGLIQEHCGSLKKKR